ncbi:DUF4038 domain-containing protein [Methylococcus sp. EFPC2]|uniref:apiosidase-like domain-containing protein n=1 Tax=Methylococcus sp. EFPC2 TaxID=2812648 RepID=UPI00196839D7|nr:DUF4038 domain-containing protein [Methylococcus sp. EFPC2]QSA98079.1 DUF4038 domain-containing protein [Methylococcus sp. EFPC2]
MLFFTFAIQWPDRASAVETWAPWEASLTSTRPYANPYANVTVSVTYTAPTGEHTTGKAFWDGGSTFRLQAMFPKPGVWTWRTTASDAANAGLHHRTGTVTVTPFAGSNPLYASGYPKVSADARYLTYANGKPFLWLGDTAWSALIAASPSEWESYIDLRKKQNFNVIQVHTGQGWVKRSRDRSGNAPFMGSGPSLQWNPAYWREVERKVRYANSQGLMVYFTAIAEPGPGFPKTNTTEVRRFARNLAARMNGYFVVYAPVADGIPTPQIDAAGAELAASAPGHLVSAHPRVKFDPAQAFHDKRYTDFAGLQSGNGWVHDPYLKEPRKAFSAPVAVQNAIDWTLALYNQAPRKPVINMEGVYDSMRLQNGENLYYQQPYPVRLPRSMAYLAMLSGSKGITYGAGGVWNWGNTGNQATIGWPLDTALARPGATQMRYWFDFFSGMAWWNLVPQHQLIYDQSSNPLNRMAFAKTPDGRLGVAYLPENWQITLDLRDFAGPVSAKWYNPVSNAWNTTAEPSLVANRGIYAFQKPSGWEDAVLLLTVQ